MSGLFDALSFSFMQRALAAGLLVAVLQGSLGPFLVLRGYSLLGAGLGQVAFAGVAIGLAAGWQPLATALVIVLGAAVAIEALRQRGVVLSDAAVAVLFTGGLGIGVTVVSAGPGFSGDLFGYLFGSLLTVAGRDITVLAWVTGLLGLALALGLKELLYVTLDEEGARAAGLPAGLVNVAFMAGVSIATVLAVQVVGVLLVSALMVLPATAGLRLASSFRGAIVASIALAVASVLIGLDAAVRLDVAAGGAVAASSVLLLALAVAYKRVVALRRRRAVQITTA
ncbi:MAG: metal ABC transporter permease [Thermoplasmatota archaeon]